jgi:hypothetical protein
VLVELRDQVDPETGERYTVKRYESTKSQSGESWQHERITLKPLNPDFAPIELDPSDAEQLRVIAELVEVLREPQSAMPVVEHTAPQRQQTEQPEEAPRREPGLERGEMDREELICTIRQLFNDGEERERDEAIDTLARDLGYQRTGTQIREELDNALRTAVRRGILTSERGSLRLLARQIDGYERDFLKEQFLASLAGRQWTEREDAARAFARWLGFRRTGRIIDETAKSLINGLLREGRLESSGSQIRRA